MSTYYSSTRQGTIPKPLTQGQGRLAIKRVDLFSQVFTHFNNCPYSQFGYYYRRGNDTLVNLIDWKGLSRLSLTALIEDKLICQIDYDIDGLILVKTKDDPAFFLFGMATDVNIHLPGKSYSWVFPSNDRDNLAHYHAECMEHLSKSIGPFLSKLSKSEASTQTIIRKLREIKVSNHEVVADLYQASGNLISNIVDMLGSRRVDASEFNGALSDYHRTESKVLESLQQEIDPLEGITDDYLVIPQQEYNERVAPLVEHIRFLTTPPEPGNVKVMDVKKLVQSLEPLLLYMQKGYTEEHTLAQKDYISYTVIDNLSYTILVHSTAKQKDIEKLKLPNGKKCIITTHGTDISTFDDYELRQISDALSISKCGPSWDDFRARLVDRIQELSRQQ